MGLGGLKKQLQLQRGLLSEHSCCDYELHTSALRGVDLPTAIGSDLNAKIQQDLS